MRPHYRRISTTLFQTSSNSDVTRNPRNVWSGGVGRPQCAVPRYTEVDENEFFTRLEVFLNDNPSYPIIPVTKHPDIPGQPPNDRRNRRGPESWVTANDAYNLQADITTALFESITLSDTAAVQHLISQGLISPDCPSATGETPLLAAIRHRSTATARTLLSLGAQVDLFGLAGADTIPTPLATTTSASQQAGRERTPLMLAAAMGNLVLVRVLMEEHGADDGAVGPEGELALRLAAAAGHRDVVRYLPVRRRGAWRRLRCSKEVRRVRAAAVAVGQVLKFLAWDAPRFVLWYAPREVVKFVWKRRRRLLGWVVQLVRAIPRAVVEVVKAVWRVVKGLPRSIWRTAMWITGALPWAWGVVRNWLVDGAKRVGSAVALTVMRLVSLLHTFFAAVISRLKEITLKDFGRELRIAMEALFVKLPRAVWSFLSRSVTVVGRAISACFGNHCIDLLLKAVFYVPKMLWSMLESLLASIGRGWDELMTLFNPKRVSAWEAQV
ncbi:hypothetical protein Daus18300_010039 [Diaporthe australafricana]|uniref:Ankyrin repeat protein n=1 Tax=Diaporthe australafricana TaxID=127596 RepID=A0ABR3WBV2_9PEZI